MFSTFLVIAGVLVGLVLLLALIVGLSARPQPTSRGNVVVRAPSWVAHSGRPHPDAWSEPITTTSELPTVR
jgi:acyl-homoserine lactone acylase PvdQ